ncbi:Uncharacterised protein [Neisseria animalis]|nr:Uncharacterised protein [Neisseria animalis]
MIQRCFALPYYVYCLRLRCLVSFLFYSTIYESRRYRAGFGYAETACPAVKRPSAKWFAERKGLPFLQTAFVVPYVISRYYANLVQRR